jgi:hypothetical protein
MVWFNVVSFSYIHSYIWILKSKRIGYSTARDLKSIYFFYYSNLTALNVVHGDKALTTVLDES